MKNILSMRKSVSVVLPRDVARLHPYPTRAARAGDRMNVSIRWCTLSLVVAATLASVPALAAEYTLQLPEDNAIVRDLDGTSPTKVCRTGARWMRIGFESLELRGSDSLLLTSSQGEKLLLRGDLWNDRSFHARALRGSCVTLSPSFSNSASDYRLSGYQAGTQSLAAESSTVAGAGDLCDSTPADCGKTSDLVIAINPNVALALGDDAYSSGTLSEFNSRYDPYWGRFKEITAPIPGNHEYATANASGYFDYFNGVGNQTGPAGDRSRGYYSYDVGEWHFIALNSRSGGVVSSTQLAWLDADLRANTKPCTAAYIHHPFISRGTYSPGIANMKPVFDRLYAARADLLLTGHDHGYQRFAPMDGNKIGRSDGVRQVIVGTGGADLKPSTIGTHSLLQAKQGTTWGVLKLELTANDYAGTFVPVAGKTYTDSFSGSCHRADGVVGDYLLTASASISIPRASSGGKIITLLSYGGFDDSIDLSISGLPGGVTATWSPNPVTAIPDGNATSRVTLRVSSTAVVGTYPLTVTGTSGEISRSVGFSIIVK
jgi:hypothetical protein